MRTESTLPPSFEEQIRLMEKQLKRVSEFGRFLPFADQQRELDGIVEKLKIEVGHLRRSLLFFVAASENASPERLSEVAERFLAQS